MSKNTKVSALLTKEAHKALSLVKVQQEFRSLSEAIIYLVENQSK